MMDYSTVDAEELEDEINLRQAVGPEGRTKGITRHNCTISYVVNNWEATYNLTPALPCTMCGIRLTLSVSCQWFGPLKKKTKTVVRVSHWIQCKCAQQEFSSSYLIKWPNRHKFKEWKVSEHTPLQLIGEWNRCLRHKIKAQIL
jgi:hypothetical protein